MHLHTLRRQSWPTKHTHIEWPLVVLIVVVCAYSFGIVRLIAGWLS